MIATSLAPQPRLESLAAPILRFFSQRHSRVLTLLAVVIALSATDLYLTLMYASTIGMPESNPLARLLLQHGTVLDLTLWKAGTVALSTGILFRLRDRKAAEVGAWVAFAALTWLTWQWLEYAQIHESIANLASAADYYSANSYGPQWVQFDLPSSIE